MATTLVPPLQNATRALVIECLRTIARGNDDQRTLGRALDGLCNAIARHEKDGTKPNWFQTICDTIVLMHFKSIADEDWPTARIMKAALKYTAETNAVDVFAEARCEKALAELESAVVSCVKERQL